MRTVKKLKIFWELFNRAVQSAILTSFPMGSGQLGLQGREFVTRDLLCSELLMCSE